MCHIWSVWPYTLVYLRYDIRVVQALLSAHLRHPFFDALSRAATPDPIVLLGLDVVLPPRVRHERHHLIESRQLGNGPATVHNERPPLGGWALDTDGGSTPGVLVVQRWHTERGGR